MQIKTGDVQKRKLSDKPWVPARFDKVSASAIKQLSAGSADAVQQKIALNWILKYAAAVDGFNFWPDSERATSFALGRTFVGQQILGVLNTNLSEIPD